MPLRVAQIELMSYSVFRATQALKNKGKISVQWRRRAFCLNPLMRCCIAADCARWNLSRHSVELYRHFLSYHFEK